jgi:mRNA interferase MazF
MNGGMMYKQRDIVVMPFPFTDLSNVKLRPGIIISNGKGGTKDRICCVITSNPHAGGIAINDFEQGRLAKQSWVKPQVIFTIDERLIRKRVCSISPAFYRKLKQEILSNIA